MCFLAEPDSCGGGGGVIHWDLHFFTYFAVFCGLWVGCHFRRGDPTFFRGLHFGVAGVSLGPPFVCIWEGVVMGWPFLSFDFLDVTRSNLVSEPLALPTLLR
jgi:hypothetical protein